ncbi:MAG TPA: hypothetical protein VGY56_18215 [Verrucomicrobiae bacterium]|nr:hypothetical protein [Verrucomicrobiae bacterium]
MPEEVAIVGAGNSLLAVPIKWNCLSMLALTELRGCVRPIVQNYNSDRAGWSRFIPVFTQLLQWQSGY